MKRIFLIPFALVLLTLFSCFPQEKRVRIVSSLTPPESKTEYVSSQLRSPEKKRKTVFYPMPPQEPRLQFLTSFSIDSSENEGSFELGNIQNFFQIQKAYDIAAAQGKIYISDRISKKIVIINLEEKAIEHISADYEGFGMWVTDDRVVYIADAQKKQILAFNRTNDLFRAYGNEGQLAKPVDVAVYENKIYVCDINRHQIVVLDRDTGETIRTIGSIGSEEGSLFRPTHVIVDGHGNIYVNDAFNFRIQKFDPQGNFLKSFGYPGDTLGGFARPKGLGVDREGHLYVVDAAFENVQIFDDETTELLLFFGGFGLEPGEMYLPSGIHIDYENVKYFKGYADEDFKLKYLIYVSNRFGPTKINVYGFGEWVGQPLLNGETQLIQE